MPSDFAYRRRLLLAALVFPAVPARAFARSALAGAAALPPATGHEVLARPLASPAAALAALEARHGGRLGVAALDTGSGRVLAQRGDERFAMCSTFKWLLAAWVLSEVEAGRESLDRRIRYGREALVSWSPVTEKHVGAGMTVGELCAAIVTMSDNGAANLLLAEHGGPDALTAWLRTTGDTITRLDRIEPFMNASAPGDPRDTTTPRAMLGSLQRLLLGNVLSPASRKQLLDWLLANKTGDARLRAGLPGWRVGDKTGSDGEHTSNDVGIAWPPGGGAPVLVAVYYANSPADAAGRDAVIAEAARIVAGWVLAE